MGGFLLVFVTLLVTSLLRVAIDAQQARREAHDRRDGAPDC